MTTNVDPIDPSRPNSPQTENDATPLTESSSASAIQNEDDEISTEDDGPGRGVPTVPDKK